MGSVEERDGRRALGGADARAGRNAMQLSQEALADTADADRSSMGRTELGERTVTMLYGLRMSQALGCKPSELIADAGL
ncbi:helix-turn-helix transcriptional regulator [Burkholderia thailandensis]|nr:helix-turn-helix transcriptional regulator [Burkholderia thailandensis]